MDRSSSEFSEESSSSVKFFVFLLLFKFSFGFSGGGFFGFFGDGGFFLFGDGIIDGLVFSFRFFFSIFKGLFDGSGFSFSAIKVGFVIFDGLVDGNLALGLAGVSLGQEIESDVEFTTRLTESFVGQAGSGKVNVFGVLSGNLSADFLEGGLFVFFADVNTDVEREVKLSLEGLSDHVFFDLFLFSELLGLELFVLFFEFLGLFLFDLDNNVGGFSKKGFFFVFFDFFDFRLNEVVFFLFSVSEHSFKAFSFFL